MAKFSVRLRKEVVHYITIEVEAADDSEAASIATARAWEDASDWGGAGALDISVEEISQVAEEAAGAWKVG